MKLKLFLQLAIISIILINCKQESYLNTSLSAEERADDLLTRLTLEEKVSLMMNRSQAVPRLGIKEYEWWNEALHGVARNGIATVFPQTIGMAASFDNELLYDIYTAVSDEARVKHRLARAKGDYSRYTGLTMWTPNINIFRDPRWGRGQETYGEDPYLTGVMGVAVIKGLQGETTNGVDKLHACAKHYAVHNGPEWSRHSFDAKNISQRDLWETYLPAFEYAVKKGKVKEVMCAYNRFEGSPCCGSDQLLMEILRKQWGYQGVVVSDCGAIRNFYMKDRHATHPDKKSAAAAAVLSGTDLNCGGTYSSITDAVEAGLITEEEINVSLKRLLIARIQLGEFDEVSPWDNLPDSIVNCQKHQELALKMAEESMVLLKNNGILPLSDAKKIVVLGPNADNEKMQWGNYHGEAKNTVTLLEAIKTAFPNSEIFYNEVSSATGNTELLFDECQQNGQKGIAASYWNNITMDGASDTTIYYNGEVKVGKRDTVAPNIEFLGISAKFNTTLTPTETGNIELAFTTDDEVALFVNGKQVPLKKKLPAIQYTELNVKKGQKYQIEFTQVHKEKGQFKFKLLRRLKPDFNKVKELTAGADVVIYAGGLDAGLEREESNVYAPGFMGGDRTDIELPKVQRDVIAALKANGSTVVLVNFSGSAMGLVPESKNCDAILQAWYPGENGGTAIVNVLTGKYNPSGCLPLTFYKNVNQLPDFEDYNMSNFTYRYTDKTPLYPFGYGLSYTTFKYGNPTLDKSSIQSGEQLKLTVPVSNTGKINGDEIVQVYLKKKGDAEGPVKTLRAFKRASIIAGETAQVEFELNEENLNWWNKKDGEMNVHSGNYTLMVGGSSDEKDLTTVDFTVL